jgi:hypothetical protein
MAAAVGAFNARYGEMEAALWALSRAARKDLLRGHASELIGEFVWTIKSWWGVQGVEATVKRLAPAALAELRWVEVMFEDGPEVDAGGEDLAVGHVNLVVSLFSAAGARRREFSLVSKALHWLMPWRIPVYDSYVRRICQVPTSWDHDEAYAAIVRWEFHAARRLSDAGVDWLGDVQPAAPFRALDKYLWWLGGGSAGQAVVVKDPWRVARRLGAVASDFQHARVDPLR